MAETQLRSRSVALEVNQDSQSIDPVVECLHTDSEIGGSDETNFQGEIQITGDVPKSVDQQLDNLTRSSDSIIMTRSQLHSILAEVMKGFQEETSKLNKSENSKIAEQMQFEISKLTEHVQRTNKKLSEDLARQIREVNAKLRKEFTSNLDRSKKG